MTILSRHQIMIIEKGLQKIQLQNDLSQVFLMTLINNDTNESSDAFYRVENSQLNIFSLYDKTTNDYIVLGNTGELLDENTLRLKTLNKDEKSYLLTREK